MSSSKWMITLCAVAMIGISGCSSSKDAVEDILNTDTQGATAEAAVESALNNVVDPVSTVIDLVESIVGVPAPSAALGIECPVTKGACISGTLVCSVGESGLDFEFTGCEVPLKATTVTIDGAVNLAGLIPGVLTLTNLKIDGGIGITGTLTFEDVCTSIWNINASDGTTVTGSIIACSDEEAQASSGLVIKAQVSGAGQLVMTFSFDGTAMAVVTVTLDAALYATCSVNLDTFDANCTGA